MIVFKTPLDIEELGARQGDFIVLDPRDVEFPISVVRAQPPEAIKVIAKLIPYLERVDVSAEGQPAEDIDFTTEWLMRRLSVGTDEPPSGGGPRS